MTPEAALALGILIGALAGAFFVYRIWLSGYRMGLSESEHDVHMLEMKVKRLENELERRDYINGWRLEATRLRNTRTLRDVAWDGDAA